MVCIRCLSLLGSLEHFHCDIVCLYSSELYLLKLKSKGSETNQVCQSLQVHPTQMDRNMFKQVDKACLSKALYPLLHMHVTALFWNSFCRKAINCQVAIGKQQAQPLQQGRRYLLVPITSTGGTFQSHGTYPIQGRCALETSLTRITCTTCRIMLSPSVSSFPHASHA